MRTILIIFVSLIVALVLIYQVSADPIEQQLASSTPVPASIPSPLPLVVTDVTIATPTQLERTATPIGPVMLEALTEANVRSQPDPESERLGTIRAGDQYVVIGRYFRWFQFQYNQTSSGIGWVFDELVTIIGDESSIADLTQAELPAQDVNLTETSAILAQTAGGILTATAIINAVPLPALTQQNGSTSQINPIPIAPEVLPTFTFPPNIPPRLSPEVFSSTLDQNASATESPQANDLVLPSTIPPILPILILGGLGVLGLLVSSSRS